MFYIRVLLLLLLFLSCPHKLCITELTSAGFLLVFFRFLCHLRHHCGDWWHIKKNYKTRNIDGEKLEVCLMRMVCLGDVSICVCCGLVNWHVRVWPTDRLWLCAVRWRIVACIRFDTVPADPLCVAPVRHIIMQVYLRAKQSACWVLVYAIQTLHSIYTDTAKRIAF